MKRFTGSIARLNHTSTSRRWPAPPSVKRESGFLDRLRGEVTAVGQKRRTQFRPLHRGLECPIWTDSRLIAETHDDIVKLGLTKESHEDGRCGLVVGTRTSAYALWN